MARATTLDELILLRTGGDWSRLRLAIQVPQEIYSARVNGIPDSNDMVNQIDFDGGSGTLADIHDSMMMYVGTSAGARDLGEVRIRKAPTSSIFYFGETSSVVWQDNAYLTIVDHFPIREKVVRVSSGITLMDSDVAFDDQHIDFDPVPVLGPHVVAQLVAVDVDVTLGPPSDTPSWVFDSTIDSVLWDIPDATTIDDDTAINPVATFDSPGWHVCYCTVTADNGKSFEGVRWVYVWDLDHQPARAFKISQDPSASYEDGGWNFAVEMYDEAHLGEVRDGALVILFAEDWYGDTKQSIGPIEGRENIICIGWIAGESIDWDPENDGHVQFTVQGPQYWMRKNIKYALELFIATNTPAKWNVMPALSVARAVWHLLHWRFNITKLMDVMLTDDERLAKKLKSTSSSLWSQINEIAWSKIFARPGCDRYARFWLEIDPQQVPESDRDFPVVQTITKKDWENHIELDRKEQTDLCILFSSGEKVDPSGSSVVLYSIAPGHEPMPYGDPDIVDGTLVSDQDQCNEQAGLYMGWKNNEYPDIPIDMPQNNRMIDLWPRQFLEMLITEEDTPRGVEFTGNLIPRSITLRIDGDAGTISASLVCEAETFAAPAIDGDVPPPDSGIGRFDMSVPELGEFAYDIPETIYSYPSPAELNENHPKEILIGTSAHGVFFTKNGDADAPDIKWEAMNAGLDSDDRTGIAQIEVCPSGSLWLVTNNFAGNTAVGRRRIYWASGLGATWNLYYDALDNNNEWVTGIGIHPFKNEQIAIHTSESFFPGLGWPGSKFYLGSRAGMGSPNVFPNDPTFGSIREVCSAILFSNNKWFVFGSRGNHAFGNIAEPYVIVASAAGVFGSEANYNGGFGADGLPRFGVCPGGGNIMIVWSRGVYQFNVIEGDTFTQDSRTDMLFGAVQGSAWSPDGLHAMAILADISEAARYTTDGTTWSAPGGAMVGPDVWESCRDYFRWIFGGGTTIRGTIDQGANYFELGGNLAYVAPLCDITNIRFIR